MALRTPLELSAGGDLPVIDGGIRSANDFRVAFRRIRGDWERIYERQIRTVRIALSDEQRKDPDLEAPLRLTLAPLSSTEC